MLNRFIILVISLFLISGCNQENSKQTKIGIIVPIEHTAMQEIVAGFSETLHEQYQKPVKIKVANAQGDANLQRAIIQQMNDQHYDIIIPIGLSATQMALSMVKQQAVLSLAADISEQDRQQMKSCNVAVVHDEIPPQKIVAFIHDAYPQITQIALIHSPSEKVFPEIKAAIASANQLGITVKPLMASTLPELYSIGNAIPSQTQAILVLKDHMIVSGISTLAKVANDRHIPLIASDQGSVQGGAAFALGVREKQIGIEGAKLAVQILQGKAACSLPITEMNKLSVFVNAKALQSENQSLEPIEAAAKKSNYPIGSIDNSLGRARNR